MFYGKVKWPLINNGKGFTYFQIQLLVWVGIMPYLLFCCIARSFFSTCFLYDIICLIRCCISLCITIEVRWNVSFCFSMYISQVIYEGVSFIKNNKKVYVFEVTILAILFSMNSIKLLYFLLLLSCIKRALESVLQYVWYLL